MWAIRFAKMVRRNLLLWPLVWTLLFVSVGGAIPPPFVPDEALARQPIIVIGKWNKTPLREHSLIKDDPKLGKVCQDTEVHTELTVERVIKGDIKPGTHKILLGFRIGWLREDGR